MPRRRNIRQGLTGCDLIWSGRRRRERGRADRVHARDPGLRLVFGHGPIRRFHVAHEVIEGLIVVAAGSGDQVPARGLDRVGLDAAAGRVHPRQPVLGNRVVLLRRLEEIAGGGALVLGDAGAVEQGDAVFDLGIGMARARREAEQARGFVQVLRHAAAFLVERGQRVLRLRVAGVGGHAHQFGGAGEVLRDDLAFEIEQRKIVGRDDMAELGGLGQEARRLRPVGRAAASGHLEHGQREHRLAVAARGGELVPVRGFLIVVRNGQVLRHRARPAASWPWDRFSPRPGASPP